MTEQTIFYKATRPDGGAFADPTVVYEVGQVVKPHPVDFTPRICGEGMLHAADVPAETLVGGSWPCRLFAVTGTPVAGLDGSHPHKAGFAELTVVEELPAWQVFGPQGEHVVALIDRAATLTADEAPSRDAAWYAARDAAGALVMRDVIGQHGFTQEHYNLLTKSWASAIGKAHPEDGDPS